MRVSAVDPNTGKRIQKRGHRVLTRPKQTKGADHRNREGPEKKRDVLIVLENARRGKSKNATIDRLPIITYIADQEKVPLSNLRAWEKDKDNICKLAGQLEASRVMGVKQRRMAGKIKTMFNKTSKDMKPLIDYMHKDLANSH